LYSFCFSVFTGKILKLSINSSHFPVFIPEKTSIVSVASAKEIYNFSRIERKKLSATNAFLSTKKSAPRKNEWVSKNAVMRLVADLVEVGNKNWTC